MKTVYSWIDAQMKQAALLSKEEQDLSVWHYLSELEPLPALEHDDSEERLTPFKAVFEEGTDATDLDDEDFGFDLADYLDEEDLGLDYMDYLTEEDQEETAVAKRETESSVPSGTKEESRIKSAPFFVRKYIAATFQPGVAGEEQGVLTGELRMRSLIHVNGQKPLQIQFLSTYLSSHWENAFPHAFSFMDWLNEFTGQIDVTYHPDFTIHLDSGPVTEEGFLAFTKLRGDTVKIGAPLKALFYYTWRFNLDPLAAAPINEKRIVYLLGDRLERQTFNQLMEAGDKQVILMGTDQESLLGQKERISTIQTVCHVHFFPSLSFYDLYMHFSGKEGSEKVESAVLGKRKINLPVFFRMRLNLWAEEGQAEGKLLRLMSDAIHEMCNEWWLEHSPKDIHLMKKIVKVSVCFQSNVTPALKRILKGNKKVLVHFKQQEYETKQAFFLQIETALTPIVDVLNERRGVTR